MISQHAIVLCPVCGGPFYSVARHRRRTGHDPGITPPQKYVARPRNSSRALAMIEAYREGKTLEEIGQYWGVTRERVRQILVSMGMTRNESQAIMAARTLQRNPLVCGRCNIEITDRATHNLTLEHRRASEHDPEHNDIVVAEYLAGKPTAEITRKSGIKNIYAILHRRGITMRVIGGPGRYVRTEKQRRDSYARLLVGRAKALAIRHAKRDRMIEEYLTYARLPGKERNVILAKKWAVPRKTVTNRVSHWKRKGLI